VTARIRGPAEAPNVGEPSIPRPAASVVLVRGGGRHADAGLEVLLLKRTEKAKFMPGVWVFPGGAVDPEDGDGEPGHRACAARELPEVVSRRFDAWFFLALAPPHTPPKADGVETTEAGWFAPSTAIDAQAAGEMALAFPTLAQLRALTSFGTAAEAIEAHRDRVVEPILPKVIGTREEHRVVLPGDPDYPS
jgi:ADP-ribose pyrophosphatase YjhB (NUDIX family)